MKAAHKIITSLLGLSLIGVSACSPAGIEEPIQQESRIEFRDIPKAVPIPPIDPAPTKPKERIITVPSPTPPRRPEDDRNITAPVATPNFGLTEIEGSKFLETESCLNANSAPGRSFLCIKIPDEPSEKMAWQDQYIAQLVDLGWTVRLRERLLDSDASYVAMLTGKRASGCRADLLGFIVSERRGLKEGLNGTYLVFAESPLSRCPE